MINVSLLIFGHLPQNLILPAPNEQEKKVICLAMEIRPSKQQSCQYCCMGAPLGL